MSAPARALSAPVTTRRVPAGITPPPGAMGALPVWWGRTDWLTAEVRPTVRAAVEVCKRHHIAPDTVIKIAEVHAGFADSRTGRECRPTNERVLEAAGCSLSTLKRGRRVLIELGLMVEVVAGRSNMTLAQRLVAHENGSSHRAIAAEFALCSSRDRRPRLVENPAADLPLVDDDPPPVGKVVRTSSREISGHLRSRTATKRVAPLPAHTEKSDRRAGRRLAEDLQRHVDWLSGFHPQRITPLLTPFAAAGWDWRDVELTLRGKKIPRNVKFPAAYLARLLDDVDLADRPTVFEAFVLADERRQAFYRRQLAIGTPCPHGQPAGNVPSPAGHMACPLCRSAG